MELREELLERAGFNVHYWTGGKAGAPLVVFTHGATIDHHEWEATLPLVSEHFRVLTWDVRGHGRSRPAPFTCREARGDLITLLDRLHVEQAILVGHSMGGNLHQEVAFHHPERVRAMICLGCTWNFQKLSPLEALSLRMAGPLLQLFPHKMLIDSSLAASVTSRAAQATLRPATESLTKAEWIQVFTATAECLHYEPGCTLGKPLLLMVGDRDQTGNIRQAMPRWAAQEPDCHLVVIPNAKHGANLDNPDFFHKTLLDFLMSRCQ